MFFFNLNKMVFVFTLLSYMFFFKSIHPLSMALVLVLVSAMVAVNAGINMSKWVMATIFLIFLGGMMVMFLYVCTLSMNEKIFFYKSSVVSGLLIFFFAPFIIEEKLWPEHVGLIYNNSWNTSVLFFIGYLIFSLLLCVKCAQSFKGALTKGW